MNSEHFPPRSTPLPKRFRLNGEQRWPERVADKLGMKPLMHLWTCDTCHTTFAEPTDTP
jgi:hypothetical protein